MSKKAKSYKNTNDIFTSNLILCRIIKKKLAVGIEIEGIANKTKRAQKEEYEGGRK